MNEMKINTDLITYPVRSRSNVPLTEAQLWEMYKPPRTLGATEEYQLAMDTHLKSCGFHNMISHAAALGMDFSEVAPQFLGYSYLAGLSQNGLIRAGVTTVADEMTKRWVEVKRVGVDTTADNEDDKLVKLTSAMQDFGLQELFNEAAQKCDFNGGCLVYVDTGVTNDQQLIKPLYLDANFLQGKVKAFTLVEAMNLYPGLYNSTNPLAPDYFKPDIWMVLGKRIHASRFLYFAPNRMNILLRPAYNFFGIPAAQLALDYVAHFTKCREAAQRLLTKFSLTVFKGNIMPSLAPGGNPANLDYRMQVLAQHRNNDSILLIDKDQEDIVKIDTNIAGTTDVVRQSLEFVAAIFRMPVVKLLGISPAGMNATGEYDDKNFLEHVAGKQEKILRKPLNRVLDLLQLHLFGEIDPTIYAEFVPLSDEDATQQATTKKVEADRDVALVQGGVIDPVEVRKKLKDDPNSGYTFIDVDAAPETPGMGGEQDYEDESMFAEQGEAEAPPALETDGGDNVQSTSLNGAQVSSMVSIVTQVAMGELPRDSGINILLAAFPITKDAAESIMGEAGNGFVPATQNQQGGQSA